jgi:hypothetical protein
MATDSHPPRIVEAYPREAGSPAGGCAVAVAGDADRRHEEDRNARPSCMLSATIGVAE